MAASVGLAAAPAGAADADFVRQCEALVARSQFTVVFADRPIARDDSRSSDELRLLSQRAASANHLVQGLTYGQARMAYALHSVSLSDAAGAVCVVPSMQVTVGLSDLTVYLARELVQPCRRAIVEAHEQEHVAVWRSHLRAGARLLEPALRNALARPFYFTSLAQAQSGLRQQVDAVLRPLTRSLQDGIVAANREIDSPASYQASSQQLNACP